MSNKRSYSVSAYVRLDLETGISIDEAAEEMLTASKALGLPTMASFNGVWLRAAVDDTAAHVVTEYLSDLEYERLVEHERRVEQDGWSPESGQ